MTPERLEATLRRRSHRSRTPFLPPVSTSRVGFSRRSHFERHARSSARVGLPDAEYNTAEDLAYPPKSMINIAGRKRHATAKLCNVLCTYVLSCKLVERVPEHRITVTTMDPGLMPGTGLAREANKFDSFLWNSVLPYILGLLRLLVSPNVHTPAESGAALARLAISADVEGTTGKHFEGLEEIKSSLDSYYGTGQSTIS
ncbi:dehydrogenase/reductase [Sclerotinia borealis F-4128]|uniref:Dehydrogenase/reductase n=1 Tax=Sclerotinia borealis (strain F-4128) TaxID=1432307 RepID=W9C8S5_SCLBF|nr:dehydrogenase/reductase [Sclerotinia borealis F-4128]